MTLNVFTLTTVGSSVDNTMGRSYTTDSTVDADALQICRLTKALHINRFHPPKKFRLPFVGILEYAINQPDSFLRMKGVKLGYASLIESFVTSTTHSPITMLAISGASKMNLKGLDARLIILHHSHQQSTTEDLVHHFSS